MGGLKGFFVITVLLVAFLRVNITPNAATSAHTTFGLPAATLFLSPPKVFGLANQVVNVKASIANVTNIYSFQLGALFDPSVVECLNVEEGGFLSNNGADYVHFIPATIDNTNGIIIPCGVSLTDPSKAKNGSGVLVNLTFRMKTKGYSNLHFYSFSAFDEFGAQIPCRIVDVYTPIREWSECSISIVGNAQGQGTIEESGYFAHNLTKQPFQEFWRLSFNVTGFPINGDSFAFCNVSIPRCFMWADDPHGAWYLFLNDVPHTIIEEYENATHTSLYFEFSYNAANPITNVKIIVGWDLGYSIPKAKLSISMSNWWFVHGAPVTVKARFTADDFGVSGGTVLFKVTYPNMSIWLDVYNYTEPNGNATFTFFINPNMPFGNYTIHILAGKVGLPGACAIRHFWVWQEPLIEPFPWQYAKYRYHMYDTNGNLYEYGWWNTTYTGYVAPNLVNCSFDLFIISKFVNFSHTDWACVNTTTRWVPEGTVMANTFYEWWIQTNVTIGSQIAIENTTGTVTGSQVVLLRMNDGTVGFADCWIVEYMTSLSRANALFFDKKTGLCVYAETIIMTGSGNFTAYLELVDTNIPIAYRWGDINYDGAVNYTDVVMMQGAWQSRIGNVDYDENADFNLDRIINIKDVTLIGINWLKKRTN
ncbi:MAG: cohesin domain-containing protein [Candidatus Bathyarchaeia archaeon]